jgi:hypothetical protein
MIRLQSNYGSNGSRKKSICSERASRNWNALAMPIDNEGSAHAAAHAAASTLSAAMAPMGCLMGLIAALFWLTMIGLAIFIGWIISLPSPPK